MTQYTVMKKEENGFKPTFETKLMI